MYEFTIPMTRGKLRTIIFDLKGRIPNFDKTFFKDYEIRTYTFPSIRQEPSKIYGANEARGDSGL